MTAARSRVLEALQQSAQAVTAGELAESLGQHANTVRGHLEALVERGLATCAPGASQGRGRPAWRYAASASMREPDARVRDYAALAFVLAEQMARSSRHPAADARAAGRIWGQLLTEAGVPGKRASARRRTVGLLTDMGFDPVARPRAGAVVLRRCPFLDLARQQSQIVCSAHEGMISAALEAYGADGDDVQLLAFADVDGCVVRFGRQETT